jgi:CelD/BcsL family acetyltransferase involved in cellulose biosynthesis
MLAIDAITDAAGLAGLKAEWQSLADRSPDATLFQTWEWQATWWRHFGRGRLWLLTARDDGALVGLAPLYISPYHGLPLRRVSFLGTGASDYLDFLTLPEHGTACREAFFEYLARHRNAWDFVDLQQCREGTLTAGAASELPDGLQAMVLPQETCPYVPLPGDWEGFAAGLGKKLRGNIGYYRRLLAREFSVECETITNGELAVTMEELFQLHQRRWRRRGLPGAFAHPRARRFHAEVAGKLLERGWLRLHRLRLDGTTRAALYCFRHGTKGYYYLGGFEPSLARYSLGTVLTAHAIEDAIATGAEEFDFLRGDEPYKYAWKPQERRNLQLLIWKESFPSCLTPRLNQVERQIEREAKRLARRLSERGGTKDSGLGTHAGGRPIDQRGCDPARPKD